MDVTHRVYRARMFNRSVLAVFVVGIVMPQAVEAQWTCGEMWGVHRLVEYHQRHKKSLLAQDVYKMLYQGSFGVEHLLDDTSHVKSYLLTELAKMDTADRGESLMEPVSTSGEIIRVNLRPFKKLNLDPASLVRVMVRSAEKTTPDTVVFRRNWVEFNSLIRYGMLNMPVEGMAELDARVASGDFSPVHHSKEYDEANAPAYRVVRCDLFESEFGRSMVQNRFSGDQ